MTAPHQAPRAAAATDPIPDRRAAVRRLALGAGAALAAEGLFPGVAAAAAGDAVILGHANSGGDQTTALRSRISGDGQAALKVSNPTALAAAIRTETNGGVGVQIVDMGNGAGRNQGVGLLALTSEGTPIKAVVQGGNSAYAPAVYAESTGLGVAVDVVASGYNGLGLRVAGQRAALRLVPQAAEGPPNDGLGHDMGELVVDANGVLYLCVAAGIPGTWRQVALA
jgi:hypothetical protein